MANQIPPHHIDVSVCATIFGIEFCRYAEIVQGGLSWFLLIGSIGLLYFRYRDLYRDRKERIEKEKNGE